MSESDPLQHFGRLITEHLRDRAIDHFDCLARRHYKAPRLQGIQDELAELSESQSTLIRRCIVDSVDHGIHDFLFKLAEEAEFDGRVQLTVDGQDVVELSDGLQAEPCTSQGWFARFSAHGESPEHP